MGLLIFVVAVGVMVVVIAFAFYGVMLGMAALGRECKRLFWPDIPDLQRGTTMESMPQLVVAPASQQKCWDLKKCLAGDKERCPAFLRQNLPCWLATMLARESHSLKPECLTCAKFSLPAALN